MIYYDYNYNVGVSKRNERFQKRFVWLYTPERVSEREYVRRHNPGFSSVGRAIDCSGIRIYVNICTIEESIGHLFESGNPE